jgi:hypothetical protein
MRPAMHPPYGQRFSYDCRMVSDPGVFLRLKAAIDSTIAGIKDKSTAAKALADAYGTFRTEAERVAVAEGVEDEFNRIFPAATTGQLPKSSGWDVDPFALVGYANEALSLLLRLSGWLDGFVQANRLAVEAEAYARARLQQEHQS